MEGEQVQVISKQRLERNSTQRLMPSPSPKKYWALMEMVNPERK